MQLHRSMRDRVIGGVCAGIAETLSIEAIYIRLAFLLFAIYAGNGLLVYLILWVILPVLDHNPEDVDRKRLFRVRHDRILGGVCGGLSRVINLDITIVRLLFVALTLVGGGGIVIYLLLWLLMPLEP